MAERAGPVRKQLEFLLNGFSFYARRDQARADDLLVRQRAAAALGHSAAALQQLAAAYRRAFLPDPTRERPVPPAGALAGLRAIDRLCSGTRDAESLLRGQGFPASDRTWARLRGEQGALDLALAFDQRLITDSDRLEQCCRAVTPEALGPEPGTEPAALAAAREALDGIRRTMAERAAHLGLQP